VRLGISTTSSSRRLMNGWVARCMDGKNGVHMWP
jgi:hypothetical protein